MPNRPDEGPTNASAEESDTDQTLADSSPPVTRRRGLSVSPRRYETTATREEGTERVDDEVSM